LIAIKLTGPTITRFMLYRSMWVSNHLMLVAADMY
jgi:hypothetical protein